MTRISADELRNLPRGKTDWAKVDALTDEDIARAVADDPDAAPLDLDWSKAVLVYPRLKSTISIRVDPDVLAFFKATGKGYQTRMNAVLRAFMDHEKGRRK
ncbi:MAG: BrnA antitoxin family protein [Rhizobiales bacterium]|nr:BrnA antitoxin family protein [Hyphomicrobiales bacterium]MBI3673155.1 BrnA antitoxin family protein [Hyphomicrobiales bacterium]